ncbi:MAG: Beta-lactamase domain protein [Myxococcales bacterium]|nr:Beta-lactamase domain protein [Myxococcales bacterium]
MQIPSGRILVVVGLLCAGASAQAQQPEQKLETQKLTDDLYLITGPGGNIALRVGKTAAFLVDDQIAPMTPQLKKAIAAVTAKPVRFVFNTHWHFDHTGGNAVFGGEGAVIVAHENVRKRLSTEQFSKMLNKKMPPSPEPALPVITFADSLSFHLDGEDIDVWHVQPAHTDGDSIVYFRKDNVLHMGDTYFSSGYPFIDLSSGGTVEGYIRAADRALAMAQPTTRIIPGHGAVTDRNKLKQFRDMIVAIRDRVKKLVAEGKTLEQVQAAKPTAEFDAAWGAFFIKPAQMVETVFEDLSKKR